MYLRLLGHNLLMLILMWLLGLIPITIGLFQIRALLVYTDGENMLWEVETMIACMMKYICIAIMVLAHPVGYYFWDFLLKGPLYGNAWSEWVHFAALYGVGSLEIFAVGLTLFTMGMVKENKDNWFENIIDDFKTTRIRLMY